MTGTATKVADALRVIAPEGKLKPAEMPLINQLAVLFDQRTLAPPHTDEPDWIGAARSKIGEKEIPGSKHNPWITGFWQRLGAAWYNDDETPWCGGFAAWCLDQVGLPYPKGFPRAASYKTYGTPCQPQVGAIGVKARAGGNHVFFIVGTTPDKLFFKALGGNQGDMVSVVDIRKSDVDALRWPPGRPESRIVLPTLPKGTISRKEA